MDRHIQGRQILAHVVVAACMSAVVGYNFAVAGYNSVVAGYSLVVSHGWNCLRQQRYEGRYQVV